MKVVILAGGLGTRISEESHLRPKPMIEVGGKPILWHIMKIYSAHGINDFIICAGYKGFAIKEYFADYFMHMSDVTFDHKENVMEFHERRSEHWRVTIVDTGEKSMTGGRLKRVRQYIGNETFCFTYGDGVSNIDVHALVDFHRKSGLKATLTGVQPPGRYGMLEIEDSRVLRFTEKPVGDGGWINGGFFVLEPSVIDLIEGDATVWEREPLEALAAANSLGVYRHTGFWHPMDTLRDRNHLEELWASGKAPWNTWWD